MLSTSARRIVNVTLARTLVRSFSSKESDFFVVNSVGVDRPGIVSGITKLVVEAGGNVGASQAAKLGSHFGLMMLVSVPKGKGEKLQSSLSNMEGMSTVCFATGNPKAVEVNPLSGYTGRFVLSGADNAGIVHSVTALLAKHRLNIEHLETSETDAPFGGATLFHMEGVASSPAPLANGFSVDLIRNDLKELADRMNCDISFEDLYDEKDNASFYGA